MNTREKPLLLKEPDRTLATEGVTKPLRSSGFTEAWTGMRV